MKSGFIAIIGRPNVGKSTLLNKLVGEKVSIVSWRPQTTRNKIRGILNGDGYQAVFVDTPGFVMGNSGLCKYMRRSISAAQLDVDLVLYVLDGNKKILSDDLEQLRSFNSQQGYLFVVINKCDEAKKANILDIMSKLNGLDNIHAVIPVSAKTGDGLNILLQEIVKCLKDGELYYPEDMYTDSNVSFMSAEIIREKALKFLQDEIPHGIAVSIEKFEYNEQNDVTYIDAAIITEKENHKPIIIGKGGETLKKIGFAARIEIEQLLDGKVFLSLFVKVRKDWQDDKNLLSEYGYNKDDN